jgi:hypothetical protein
MARREPNSRSSLIASDFWYVTDNAVVARSSQTIGQPCEAVEKAILGYFPHTGA